MTRRAGGDNTKGGPLFDFSIGFHEVSTTAMPTIGVDRFERDRAARHMISHTTEMMLAAMAVI